jgi:hypothetical protein
LHIKAGGGVRRCEWTGSVDYPVKQVSGALNLGLIFEQKRRLAFGDTRLTFEDCHVIAKTCKIYPWFSLLRRRPLNPDPQLRVRAFEPKPNETVQGVVKRTVPPGANKDLFLASLIFYPECSSDL